MRRLGRQRAPRPSRHGLVAAYLALFAALAGTAWAAATVGSGDVVNNSLKSADLKNNGGVKTPHVRNRSLGGPDVRAGSLRAGDFGPNSIGGADIDESTLAVGRIVRTLGGPVGQPVAAALDLIPVPNTAFVLQPSESIRRIAGIEVTFSAACTAPRDFTAYLLLDGTDSSNSTTVGIVQVEDAGTGDATRRATFGIPPPGSITDGLVREGAAVPHQYFVRAQGTCNSGSGIMLDAVTIDHVGYR